MLAIKIARCEKEFHLKKTRALQDYAIQIQKNVEDYLMYLQQHYPFRCYDQLYQVVMEQLKSVLDSQDFRHKSIEQIREGNINWLVQPFFKGEKLIFSMLLDEYDKYRYNPQYLPSVACRQLFLIKEAEVFTSAKRPRDTDDDSDQWDA